MRNACLWAVLTASLSLAQSYNSSHCDADGGSQPAWMTTNAVVLWNAVADNSIAVVGGKQQFISARLKPLVAIARGV